MATDQKQQSEEEYSTYGTENSAFYVGQGKDPNGNVIHVGAKQERRRRHRRVCGCWLVGLRQRTWTNLLYNLFVNISFSSFAWALFTALVLLGGTLIPFCCLGVPVFLLMLQLARWMADGEISIVNGFSPPSQKAYRPPEESWKDQGLKVWARSVGCSCQSYKDWIYLWLFKWPVALANCIIAAVVVGVSVALISSPIVWGACPTCMKEGNLCWGSAHGSWSDGTCDGWKIDSLGDAFGLAFLGIVCLIVSLHISNGLAYFSMSFSRCMLTDPRDEGLSRNLLSSTDDQARAYCTCPHSKSSMVSSNAPSPSLSGPPLVVIVEGS